jgi:hypothetical protein
MRGGNRLRQSTGVGMLPRGDGAVLADSDAARRLVIDAFGRRVWALLVDRPTLASLVMRLRDEGTPAERLAEDVTRLLARWRAAGVIAWW